MCFYYAVGFAQEPYVLSVKFLPNELNLARDVSFERKLKDSSAVYQEIEKIKSQLQFKGFLLAELDSISFKSTSVHVIISARQFYKWVDLAPGNLPLELRQIVGFRDKDFNQTSFDGNRLQRLFSSVLRYYEDNGFPFAAVSLDSIHIGKSSISAKIKIKPYQKFSFDSIQVVGSAQISQKYLQSYLNIKEGAVYRENTVKQVESRLRELPFLQVVKSTEVDFSIEKAVVRVFVNRKNANQFDGILGLQQNNTTGKSQLVGNAKLHLHNALKVGEQLDLNYQGLSEQSQLLEFAINVPHILNTSFGLSPLLYFYKQDSSYVNVDSKLGFNYVLNGNNTFQFFVENRSTSLVAAESFKNLTTLPNNLDASTFFYGLGLSMENLDYRFNPQKGYNFDINFAVGTKKIKRNSAIPEQLYAGLPLTSTSYRLYSQFNYYKALTKSVVLALSNQTALLGGNNLLENELFKLGGQKSLRGFNELSLLATSYTFANAEIRYLLAQNSFFFAFYNHGYLRNDTAQLKFSDFPLGLGTGVNFDTNLGILSVSYALGKQKNNPLNLRQGKIHFGITALF